MKQNKETCYKGNQIYLNNWAKRKRRNYECKREKAKKKMVWWFKINN